MFRIGAGSGLTRYRNNSEWMKKNPETKPSWVPN